jgi:hypothetical protein
VFAVAMLTVGVALLSSTGWAVDPIVHVNIPFEFSVDDTLMAPGSYVVMLEGPNSAGLILRSERSGEFVRPQIMARTVDAEVGEPQLVFDVFGDAHHLSEIHIPGMDSYALRDTAVAHGHEALTGVR